MALWVCEGFSLRSPGQLHKSPIAKEQSIIVGSELCCIVSATRRGSNVGVGGLSQVSPLRQRS